MQTQILEGKVCIELSFTQADYSSDLKASAVK